MCEAYRKAREAVWEYMTRHRSFKLSDIVNYVWDKARTTRVNPNVTIKDYLKGLEDIGFCKEVRFNEFEVKINK